MIEMREAPPHLEEQTQRMQAAAPYCGLGFKKVTLPRELRDRLFDHLQANRERFRAEEPIDFLANDDRNTVPALFFEDKEFNATLSRDLQPLHEEWAGQPLTESACYGIRVYQRGSFLYNHVDHTDTHIISSTICVDHRLSSPWPVAIEGIDGEMHQVPLDRGEMLFYESARLRHGRPYPLQGDYYASIFVHYRPSVTPGNR